MKSKIKIGFDVDDVVLDTIPTVVENLIKEFPEKDINISKITKWDMSDCLGLPVERTRQII